MKDLLKKMSQLEASAPKAAPKKKILKESAPAAKVESKNMSLKDMFKQLDEALAPGQKPLPVISKVGSNQTTGAGFLNIDDNSPAGQALQQALGNLAGQNKAEIVVPTQPNQSGQSTQPNQSPNQGGGTIQTSASQDQQAQDAEDQIAERDEGKPGKNFAKIAKKAGKEYGSKAAGERVAGAIRAKLAKQGKLEEEQLDEKWGGDTELNPSKKGMFKGKTKAELEKQLAALHKSGPHKKGSPEYTKQQELNFAIRAKGGWKKGVKEADIPSAAGIDTYGAALGAGRSPTTLEGKKAKPDFLDLDKDGDKKESMKKAAADKKKKEAVKEARMSSGERAHHHATEYARSMKEGNLELAMHHRDACDECGGMIQHGPDGKKWHMHSGINKGRPYPIDEGVIGKVGLGLAGAAALAGVGGIAKNAYDYNYTPDPVTGITRAAGDNITGMDSRQSAYDMNQERENNFTKESKITQSSSDSKKKKAVKENMSNRIRAARFEGKSHGLKGHSYAGKNYDDMEECRAYHDGYKEGLDECYGMATPHMPATTHGMADQSIRDPYTGTLDEMYDEMDEGNAFTAALARTPKGSKFKLGGKSFTDTSSYDSTLDENDFAFESWNRELETLINEGKKINESKKSLKKSLTEGMTISISKGQQGSPDSVNINATDSEADQVISLIKQAGLGIFGGEGGHEELGGEPRGFSIQAPSSEVNTPGDIEIVDDNEGMLGLMKKLSGIQHDGDDAGESDEVSCENCGMPESDCECEEGKLDEVESEDQMSYEVAEDEEEPQQGQSPAQPQNPSDNGSANSTNATKGNNAANNAAAEYDTSQKEENGAQQVDEEDEECEDCHSKPCECDDDEEKGPDHNKNWYDTSDELKEEGLNEWANNAGQNNDEDWEADIDFMTKVISGGLNKQKSTGQTTVPVIAGQNDRMHSHNTKDINESASDWAKLAGIRK
jgi:hypothetical protein